MAAGGAVFGTGVATRILAGGPGGWHGTDLTEREAQVQSLIAQGANNPDIGRELGVSVKTVQNHVSHVLA